MGVEVILFGVFGLLAIAFAIGMLISENAVHSALFLIANFGCVAFMFLMLNAPFISMVQVAVYAGAIMVLFLFVIMLLGAERTTDTTRRFRWLAGAATILGASLLISLALPMVLAGFRLPATSGTTPLVRVTNATTAMPNLTLTLTSPARPEPFVIDNLAFGDSTAFIELPAGDYSAMVTQTADGGIAAPPQTITLANNQVVTLMLYGLTSVQLADELGVPRPATLAVIPNDPREVGDNAGRLVIFNGFINEPLWLVDLGPDKVINTITRDGQAALLDTVVAPDIPYNAAPVIATFAEGTYDLAFVRTTRDAQGSIAGYEVVHTLPQYQIVADTEDTLILTPDGSQPIVDAVPDAEDPATQGIQPPAGFQLRPVLISDLAFDTQPAFGSPLGIGRMLFTDYLLPVNLVGLLLLVALIGVIVLNRPSGEKQERRGNQRRKVSRPLVNVIAQQTGGDVVVDTPKLGSGE